MPVLGGQRSGLASASAGGSVVPRSVGGLYVPVAIRGLSILALGLGANAGGRYYDAIMADGPSAYWRMDEQFGHFIDAVASLTSSTETAITYGVAGAVSGDVDTAVSYNGTTSVVSIPSSTALDVANGPFSIEAWVQRSGIGTVSTFLDKGSTGGTAWVFFFPADNTVRFGRYDTAASIMDSGAFTVTDTTTWHHIVATKNGAARALYIDGVDRTTLGTDFTLANSTNTMHIGTSNFAGSIDEVAIYPTVLTPAQVLNHYYLARQAATSTYAQTVLADAPSAYWRLDESTGSIAYDAFNRSNGSYLGSTTLGQAGAISGDAGTAVQLDGTSGIVQIANTSALALGNGPLSIEAWFRRTGTFGATAEVMSKGTQFAAKFKTDNKLYFDQDGTNSATSTSVFSSDTGFHHMVCVHDAGAAKQNKIYIDGVEEAVSGTNNTFATEAGVMKIGAYSLSATEFFGGYIDEVAVYPLALTATQVTNHYNAGQPSLVLYPFVGAGYYPQ